MRIETKRLLITEFEESMARAVHENSLDGDTRKFLPDEVFETVEDAEDTIRFLIAQYETEDGPLVYPVLTKAKENIGYVELAPIKEGWEIGYHIAKPYTGNGYAAEAVSAFLPVISKAKNLSVIYGISRKDNAASIRVLEKCGFQKVFDGSGNYQGRKRKIVKYVRQN